MQYNRKMSSTSDSKVRDGSQAQAPVMANINQDEKIAILKETVQKSVTQDVKEEKDNAE